MVGNSTVAAMTAASALSGADLFYVVQGGADRKATATQVGAFASGLTVGSTAIASGTTTRILYDNAGALGEYTITGSGTVVAMATSPTLVTPTLGVATATSINKVALTAPATSATLTIANGKTLTASNTLTFTGTDASSVNCGAGGTVSYTTNGAPGVLTATLVAADFNSTADQAITILYPPGFTRFMMNNLLISHASVALTTSVGGFYTATSKGGVAIVAAGQTYAAITSTAENTNGNALNCSITNTNTQSYNVSTVYLSLTVPQGTAATADVSVVYRVLP